MSEIDDIMSLKACPGMPQSPPKKKIPKNNQKTLKKWQKKAASFSHFRVFEGSYLRKIESASGFGSVGHQIIDTDDVYIMYKTHQLVNRPDRSSAEHQKNKRLPSSQL